MAARHRVLNCLSQRPTTRSSSRRCASEGAGLGGMVLKDFLSRGANGSVALAGNELTPKQMDAASAIRVRH